MPRSRVSALGLLLALGVALIGPQSYADTTTPPSPTSTDPTATTTATPADQAAQQAQDALAAVQDIFDAGTPGVPADPSEQVDATMALHSLQQALPNLSPRQRQVASRYLSRPTDSSSGCPYDSACYRPTSTVKSECAGHICVHYTTSAGDSNAVSTEDDGAGGQWPGTALNNVPDMVDFALQQLTYVNNTYVNAGYRQTRGDSASSNNGGSGSVDIYLADVGGSHVYGYCTSDDPQLNYDGGGDGHPAVSAYCVLDNDYSASQFGTRHTPAQNLQVTAAHEYFHAVQFAYDFDEDAWLMEATAVWAEDELYDGINDNRAYLKYGPMHRPSNPLDLFEDGGLNQYGAWCFFRYLTEHFPAAQGGLATLVRQVWTRAASTGTGAKGEYSLQAIRAVLHNSDHTTLEKQFTNFVMANRFPAQTYAEGSHYPAASLFATLRPTASRPDRSTSLNLHRLAAKHLRYVPGTGLRGGSKIRISVNGAPLAAGEAVVVRYKPVDSAMKRARFRLSSSGDGAHTFPFGNGAIAWLEVTVLNTSTRYRCHTYGSGAKYWEHTCQGTPRDDADATTVAVHAIR